MSRHACDVFVCERRSVCVSVLGWMLCGGVGGLVHVPALQRAATVKYGAQWNLEQGVPSKLAVVLS